MHRLELPEISLLEATTCMIPLSFGSNSCNGLLKFCCWFTLQVLFASSDCCGTVARIGTVLRARTFRLLVGTDVSTLISSILE